MKWECDVDTFASAARAMFNELVVSEADFLKQQARLLTEDLVHMTPPFEKGSGEEAITKQSYNFQRKVGERAVLRDIKKVFRPISPLGRYLARRSSDPTMKQRIEDYALSGNLAAIRTIVRDMLGSKTDVRREVEPALHSARRTLKGRVRRSYPVTFILDERQLRAYIKEVQGHVGKAKAGWAKAAGALGLQLPAWITRHHTPGVYSDDTRNTPILSITVGNSVRWADDFADLRIIEAGLKIRTINLQKGLERLMEAKARKWNSK